jgi:hypothetical protein
MFVCPRGAVVDGVDGTIARHAKVASAALVEDVPDLVVDFVTMFRAGHAIAAGGLPPGPLARGWDCHRG